MTERSALLSADEHQAIDLCGQLAELVVSIIGNGPQSHHDLAEMLQYIHQIQQMIMSQAAARAYPNRYRLLGGRGKIADGA